MFNHSSSTQNDILTHIQSFLSTLPHTYCLQLLYCQLWKWNYRQWIFCMFSNHFFHPYHVIPASELEPALVEFANFCESEVFMEICTVCWQVFMILFRIPDAGIQIKYPHLFKLIFQSLVNKASQSALFSSIIKIYRHFA